MTGVFLRISHPYLWWERMSTINMLSVILKIWLLISAFMLCNGSFEFFLLEWSGRTWCVLSCSHSPTAWPLVPRHRQVWVRASFIAFLMLSSLWPMLSACIGFSCFSVLPWVRSWGCCITVSFYLFFLDFFSCRSLGDDFFFPVGMNKGSSYAGLIIHI